MTKIAFAITLSLVSIATAFAQPVQPAVTDKPAPAPEPAPAQPPVSPSSRIYVHTCIGQPTPKELLNTFARRSALSESVDRAPKTVFERCDATLDADSDIASRPGGTLSSASGWVEVYFYREEGGTKTIVDPQEAQFDRVEVSSEGKIYTSKNRAFGTTVDVPLNALASLSHLSLVKVSVFYKSDPDHAVDERYFRFVKRVSPYGIAGKETYFWIPVGLFGTSFQKNDNGYEFSAFPVGLAVGLRIALQDHYFGLSAMLDYTIHRGEAPMGSTASDVSLSGATAGILGDIDGYLYVGGGYIFDWRKDASNPGLTFVIGAGPHLLQYLQGK